MFESYSLDNFFQVFPTAQRVPLFTGSEASFLSFLPNDDRNIVATLYSKPSQGAADDDSFSTKISDGLLFYVYFGALTKLFGC